MADPNSMEIESSTVFVVGGSSSPSKSVALTAARSSSTLSEGAVERILDDALSITSDHVNAHVDMAPPLTAPTAQFERMPAEARKARGRETRRVRIPRARGRDRYGGAAARSRPTGDVRALRQRGGTAAAEPARAGEAR